MKILSIILITFVAIEHFYILWMEMFAWTTAGKKAFKKFPPDFFEKTKKLAANQGLYNGFLAAGLIWSLLITNEIWSRNITCFFLSCVVIAGLYGGITSSKSILMIQAVPAVLALLVTVFA